MVAVILKALSMKFEAKFSERYKGCLQKEYFHLEYQRLKSLLKECQHSNYKEKDSETMANVEKVVESPQPCTDCEKLFVSEVSKQISAIICCFSLHARRLLCPQVSWDLQRYLWRPRYLFADYHQGRIADAHNLISYAARNAVAIGKLLIKYKKACTSNQTLNFNSKFNSKRLELLKSPWLLELCTFVINFSEGKENSPQILGACPCNITFTGVNGPSITCTLLESIKIDFSLTCPICLDTAFQPIALGCGHIFCNSCACSSASVPTIAGVKAANKRARCPLCRQVGVYISAVHLVQSGLLLKKRCKEFWKERLQWERAERVKQAKEHWNQQSRLFIGF